VSYAQLCKQGIDGSELDSPSSANIAKLGRGDMVLSLRLEQRQRRKPFDDLGTGFRTREALQKFLQYEASRDDDVRPQQGFLELLNLRLRCRGVPPKRQRPNAGVDEDRHVRDRSAL